MSGEQHPINTTQFSTPESRLLGRMRSEFGRVPFLRSGDQSLEGVMQRFATSFGQEAGEIAAGTRKPENMRAYILSVEGTPGSGKTYITQNLILPYLQSFSRQIKEAHGVDMRVVTLHWDVVEERLRHAEKKGRRKRMPFMGADTPEFLERVEQAYKEELAQLIQNRAPYTVIVVDKPNGTAAKSWYGSISMRPYATDMVEQLLSAKGPFADISRRDVWVGAIGCVGSPSVEIYTQYRHELMMASTLEEANMIQQKFWGVTHLTTRQWSQMRLAGSLEAVRAACYSSWAAARHTMFFFDNGERLPDYVLKVVLGKPKMAEDIALVEKENPQLLERAKQTAAVLHQPVYSVLWRACYRLAEAILLENSFGLDTPMGFSPDAASIIYNDPPFANGNATLK